jgi:hypothetical protein
MVGETESTPIAARNKSTHAALFEADHVKADRGMHGSIDRLGSLSGLKSVRPQPAFESNLSPSNFD